jgi:nitroreductase
MADYELFEAMSTLRAVRRLKPDPIPDAAVHRVLEAATWAPSGANTQPFRVIVVKDREKMAALGALYSTRWNVYVKGHMKALENGPESAVAAAEKMLGAGNYLADHFAETPVLMVFCFNPKMMAVTDAGLDRVSVVGGGSVYPAVQNALLACRAQGLGCVLTTLLCADEEEVRELLAIPQPWGTAAAIPIGYPVLGGHGPITRRPAEKIAFSDAWNEPYSLAKP